MMEAVIVICHCENGKFDKRYKTNWVEADDSNDVVEYYLSRPEKYPEIKNY